MSLAVKKLILKYDIGRLRKYLILVSLIWFVCLAMVPLNIGVGNHSSTNNQLISIPDSSIDDFSVNVLNYSSVLVSWDIIGDYTGVEVYRKFIDRAYLVGVFDNKTSEFTFTNHVYGTDYTYYFKVLGNQGNLLATSENIKVMTSIDSNDISAPTSSWEEYRNWNYPIYSADYLNYSSETHDVYDYHLHGVKVVIAFGNEVSTAYNKQDVADKWFNIFNRLWYKFLYFPIDEYRIVIQNDGAIQGEDTLGLFYPPSEIDWLMTQSGSKQSHEVCHAWIGSVIGVENNAGGVTFDPVTEDSDKWILEGFDSLYGNLGLDPLDAVQFINEVELPYYDEFIAEGLDMPLVDLPVYFMTPDARTYYVKGEIFALYVHKILYENASLTLNQFMQLWISKYNLTYENSIILENLMSTPELLHELNEFSGLNFTEDFQKYVYGIERIPIYTVTYTDIEPLILIDDKVKLEDYLGPLISITSPKKDEILDSQDIVVTWSIYENSKLEEVNLILNNSSTLLSNAYIVRYSYYNLTDGSYEFIITARDDKGNWGTKTAHFTVDTDLNQTDTFYLLGITGIFVLSLLNKVFRKKKD